MIRATLKSLGLLSEARGKDSSGLVFRDDAGSALRVFKGAIPISDLLSRPEIADAIRTQAGHVSSDAATPARIFAAMGHARLVTNGTHVNDDNNQPVVKDGVVAIHNGIIVNADELWARTPGIQRTCDIDTEVVLAMVAQRLRAGEETTGAVAASLSSVVGTASMAFLFEDRASFVAATNNGSLYAGTDDRGVVVIASEAYFLREAVKVLKRYAPGAFSERPILPGHGVSVDLQTFGLREFDLQQESCQPVADVCRRFPIEVRGIPSRKAQKELVLDPALMAASPRAAGEMTLLEDNAEELRGLRRCSRCILPETFPFIEYDAEGVCNYCRNYRIRNQPKPLEQLLDLASRYRRSGGAPDCIVPISGGRDSTFTLHVVKNVLKLNPITVTYDWGMVTDLARRNIARVCGKLRVENVIAAADISWKRENIRRNVEAWLRRPDLGMIPLFMAGDKFFYYYVNKLKQQTGIDLNIWGINPLENTDFKVGFLGVTPNHGKERIYSISGRGKAQLFAGVGRNVLLNPAYLNRSVVDTFGSFLSRYIIRHRDYYHLFDYYRWDEREIEELIVREYDWETAIDAESTWRVGDGTAAFYNYIYCTVAGFTEADTFRSNQVREGMMTREAALTCAEAENRPRYPTLRWYLDIVGLDFTSTIKTINAIPKLYRAGGVRAARSGHG